MDWSDGLTDEQIRAASHVGSPACLLAGPGTGKTRVLTHRVLFLLNEAAVLPDHILVLTFTRAAAAELRGRLAGALGDAEQLPQVRTLHSFALSTLLRSGDHDRLPQPLRVADDYEERWIIEEDLKRLLGLQDVRDARALLQEMSADWERLAADETGWEARFPDPRFIGAWREHRGVFAYTLRAELVYQLKHCLEEGTASFETDLGHVLVDEYQDLNPCDLAVTEQLMERGAELFASGDDDQSIYGFRHAEPQAIRDFGARHAGAVDLSLTECHRCGTRILETGLYVALQDYRRVPKSLRCCQGACAGEVALLRFQDQNREADGVARLCGSLSASGVAWKDMLILVRSDRNRVFSRVLERALHSEGVPCVLVSDPMAVFSENEPRQLLALLRLMVDPNDSLAWRTLLQLQHNHVGKACLREICEHASSAGVTFAQAIMDLPCKAGVSTACRNAVQAAIVRVLAQTAALSSLCSQAPDTQTFLSQAIAAHITDADTRREVVDRIAAVVSQDSGMDLEALLTGISLGLGSQEQDRPDDQVSIMTMHQAKGLTADAVFVVAAEREYLPGRAQGREADDELRLFYVSLTRARTHLFITHCMRRTDDGQRNTGSTAGSPERHLTPYLQGGPLGDQDGQAYVNRFCS